MQDTLTDLLITKFNLQHLTSGFVTFCNIIKVGITSVSTYIVTIQQFKKALISLP